MRKSIKRKSMFKLALSVTLIGGVVCLPIGKGDLRAYVPQEEQKIKLMACETVVENIETKTELINMESFELRQQTTPQIEKPTEVIKPQETVVQEVGNLQKTPP